MDFISNHNLLFGLIDETSLGSKRPNITSNFSKLQKFAFNDFVSLEVVIISFDFSGQILSRPPVTYMGYSVMCMSAVNVFEGSECFVTPSAVPLI